MTATAGPGISLMGEFAGLAYYAEAPAVIFDVQRVGPSTGLPTRTAQGDLLQVAFLSHGDTKHIMIIPALGRGVLHDGAGGVRARRAVPDAGVRDDGPRSRHEQLDVGRRSSIPTSRSTAARCSRPRSCKKLGEWGRYKDVDGDGIAVSHDPRRRHAGVASRAAPVTTPRASTASGRTITSRTWTGWSRKFDTARKFVPEAGRAEQPESQDRLHRLRHVALRDRGEPRSAA